MESFCDNLREPKRIQVKNQPMSRTLLNVLNPDAPAATLVIRLLPGLLFFAKGIKKFMFPAAWGVGRSEKIGIIYPGFTAPFVGVVETVCGVLLILGFLTRPAALLLFIDISVAILTTKAPMLFHKGFWPAEAEARTDYSMFMSTLFLLIVGGGLISLDASWAKKPNNVAAGDPNEFVLTTFRGQPRRRRNGLADEGQSHRSETRMIPMLNMNKAIPGRSARYEGFLPDLQNSMRFFVLTLVTAVTPVFAQSPTTITSPAPSPSTIASPAASPSPPEAATYFSCHVDGPYIAMTFDDGPSPGTTTRLLDILKERNIKATFFMIGPNVVAHPEIARRVLAEGHEIGNHSWTHPQLSKLL